MHRCPPPLAAALRAHCLTRARFAAQEAALDAAAWLDWLEEPAYARRACPDAGRYLADAARHTAALARRYHAGRFYAVTVECASDGAVHLAVGLA